MNQPIINKILKELEILNEDIQNHVGYFIKSKMILMWNNVLKLEKQIGIMQIEIDDAKKDFCLDVALDSKKCLESYPDNKYYKKEKINNDSSQVRKEK